MKEQGQDVTEITKRLIKIENLKPEELEQRITKDVVKRFPITVNPTDKQYVFFVRLISHYIDLCYQNKVQWKENLSEAILVEVYRELG